MKNNLFLLRINKSVLCYIGIVNILMFICLILNTFVNVDVIGAVMYVALMLWFFRQNRLFFVKYIRFFIMGSYHLVSVFLVNNFCTYFYNLQQYSSNIGAFMPLLVFYTLEFSVMFLLESNVNSRILQMQIALKESNCKQGKEKSRLMIKVTSVVLFITIFYMLFRVLGNGYYSMGGVDRFAFRAKVFTGLDEKLYNYIIWFLPIPLILHNLGSKKVAISFLFLVCVYYLGVGDKFSSLMTVFYIYLLVCWATKSIDKKMMRKIVVLVAAVLTVLLGYVAYQTIFERGGGLETIVVYFHNRLTGGQSDLWWKIYDLCKAGETHILEFGDELRAIVNQPSNVLDYNFGIYKMMKIAAPSSVVNSYLSRGARFAASTQASVYYYFNLPGLLVWGIITAIILFWTVNHAVYAYSRMDVIESVCYTLILQKVMLLTAMSDITVLGHSTFILSIIVLFVRKYLRQRR